MNARGRLLEHHTLVVRDGRILDVLPAAQAADRYAATVALQRPEHLLMPGMINAHTQAAMTLFRGQIAPADALEALFLGPEFVRDGTLAAIAEMLGSGVTCFGDRYFYPDEAARAAGEQGMRAVIGLPVADTHSPWARNPAEYLTAGLRVRDEYAGHPLISTVFAPHAPGKVSDATFARVATLADELDAGIVIDLHESADDIALSVATHGARPIERLWRLGLLTPALNAVHMAHASAQDVDLARRTGIAVSLSSSSSIRCERLLPPAAEWTASGVRLGLGSGGGACGNQDLWGEMRLLALMLSGPPRSSEVGDAAETDHAAWDALAAATRGGAEVLGLEREVGTLESGKWADVCCVDLGGPATQPLLDPVAQLVRSGGRDIVSDVWVAGRQLLSGGELTRLDWPKVAAHAAAWAMRMKSGG